MCPGERKGSCRLVLFFFPAGLAKGERDEEGPSSILRSLARLAWVQIPLQITAAAAAAMELFLSLFPARSAMEAIKVERNCRGFPPFIRVQAALMRRDGGGEFPLSIHMQYLSSSDVEGSIAFCSLLDFEPQLRFLLLHLHTQRPFGCMALPACKVDAPSNSAVPSGKFGLFSVGADAQGTSTNFCLLGTTSSLSAISRDILPELL